MKALAAFWQWFLKDGDKILAAATGITATLNASGVIASAWATPILATLTFIHNTFLPEPAATAAFPNTTAGKFPPASAVLMVFFLAALAIGSVTQLSGCAALGITKPLTFNDSLGVGYGTATAVLTTTDTLLNAGKINDATAKNIEAQDVNLKAALDIAAQVNATNTTDGGNQLQAALTAINALSTYLATLQPAASK
jgi:hypothetical protein